MKKTKIEYMKELEDLNRALGAVQYRRSSMFPGPGIEEDEKLIKEKIKKLKLIGYK